MSNIVERLRAITITSPMKDAAIRREAADVIENLQAEVQRLESELRSAQR